MIVVTIAVVTWLLRRVLLRGPMLSVETATYVAFLLAIGYGLEISSVGSAELRIAIGIGFYLVMALGHGLGRRIRLDRAGWASVGERLIDSRSARALLCIWFIAYPFVPLAAALAEGQSLSNLLAAWSSSGSAARSQEWVAYVYGQADIRGVAAVLRGISNQLGVFWYLSVGVVAATRSRLLYPVLVSYIIVNLLISGGTRTLIVQAAALVALVWLLSAARRGSRVRVGLRNLLILGALAVTVLLALDALLAARLGVEATGGISERVERTLRQDIAYGGLGLELLDRSGPPDAERTRQHAFGLLGQPVPRAVWPEKPVKDPNWAMTEAYFDRDLTEIGSILLFTPLGEALFYYGYLGLLLVPFAYGLLVSLAARVYACSPVFVGLLANAYLWAMLGMRLTFWNVYSSLVSASLLLLLLLVAMKYVRLRYGRRSAVRVSATAAERAVAG